MIDTKKNIQTLDIDLLNQKDSNSDLNKHSQLKFGLIGKTLNYSYSKLIHEKIFELAKIDASYDLIEQSELYFSKEYTGYNITIPYKAEVVKFIDSGDKIVNSLHIANTVDMRTKLAYNTDAQGFLSLHKDFDFETIIILGTGASSVLVNYLLTEKLHYLNQNENSVKFINKPRIISLSRTEINEFIFSEFIDKYKIIGNTLMVNCTPLGTKGFESHSDEIIKLVDFVDGVIDLVYNPAETMLIKKAKSRGIYYINGLKMLVVQAVEANIIWGTISKSDKEFYIHEVEEYLKRVIEYGGDNE